MEVNQKLVERAALPEGDLRRNDLGRVVQQRADLPQLGGDRKERRCISTDDSDVAADGRHDLDPLCGDRIASTTVALIGAAVLFDKVACSAPLFPSC